MKKIILFVGLFYVGIVFGAILPITNSGNVPISVDYKVCYEQPNNPLNYTCGDLLSSGNIEPKGIKRVEMIKPCPSSAPACVIYFYGVRDNAGLHSFEVVSNKVSTTCYTSTLSPKKQFALTDFRKFQDDAGVGYYRCAIQLQSTL